MDKLSGRHDSDHDHQHQAVPSDFALRVKSLESLLVEKGLVDPAALDALIDTYEHKVGPRNGARVVARAWVDPAYRERLLRDADAAIAALMEVAEDFSKRNAPTAPCGASPCWLLYRKHRWGKQKTGQADDQKDHQWEFPFRLTRAPGGHRRCEFLRCKRLGQSSKARGGK